MSTGNAGLLGLDDFLLKVKHTTAHLMTHAEDGCVGNCTHVNFTCNVESGDFYVFVKMK